MDEILELVAGSLAGFDVQKPWPEAMLKLQARLIPLIDYDDMSNCAPALQWAWKAVAPWPTCENNRKGERGDYLLRALEALTNRAAPEHFHFSENFPDMYGANQRRLPPNNNTEPADISHATPSTEPYAVMTFGSANGSDDDEN